MQQINKNIINFLTSALKALAAGLVILFVWAILVFCLLMMMGGCRTVKKTQDTEKTSLDSLSSFKHDSSSVINTAYFNQLLSADSFGLHIVFKGNSKPTINPQAKTASFIDNLVWIANSGEVESIDINAKKLKDSTSSGSTNSVMHVKNDSMSHVVDSSKIKKTTKDITSNTNLLAIGGGLILLLSIFFAIWKYTTKKVDTVTNTIDSVNKIIK